MYVPWALGLGAVTPLVMPSVLKGTSSGSATTCRNKTKHLCVCVCGALLSHLLCVCVCVTPNHFNKLHSVC